MWTSLFYLIQVYLIDFGHTTYHRPASGISRMPAGNRLNRNLPIVPAMALSRGTSKKDDILKFGKFIEINLSFFISVKIALHHVKISMSWFCLFICWGIASSQHIRSCQDSYRLVALTLHTYSDCYTLFHWETRPLAPWYNFQPSQIILIQS